MGVVYQTLMKAIFISCIGIMLYAVSLGGQITLQRTVISSLGSSTSVAGIYLSQTAGQPSNTDKFTNQLILSQGFQQAYRLLPDKNTSVEPNLECKVYPNPFVHSLFVELSPWKKGFTLFLCTLQGKRIKQFSVSSARMRLDLQDIPYGVYLLSVNKDDKRLITYRIVKLIR